MIEVASFVNARSELQERENKAREYSEHVARERKASRLNAVGFFVLAVFDFATMFAILAYYVFVG